MSIIQIDHLTRDYGSEKGIFDLTLHVKKGEVFGFLGPNGAGKTTTIRHLMGFLNQEAGTCKIDGMDTWGQRELIQASLGYIPGEISFFDDMTGLEFLKFSKDYRHMSADNRMAEMMDRFELDPKGKIKKMSKGTKQKLGIVAAFMHDPSILILDEPTSGLDPLMQNRFIALIAEEKQKGKTIFLSSHLFEEVEKTCDRIGIIRKGRLVTVEAVDVLRDRHMHTYHVQLEDAETALAFANDFNGQAQGNRVLVSAKKGLEQIFMDYYGDKNHD